MAAPYRAGAMQEALEQRRTFLGPSFSTHYTNPIVVRRGKGAVLFDDRDQGFIDLVNNPASIGHSHPLPARAAALLAPALLSHTQRGSFCTACALFFFLKRI